MILIVTICSSDASAQSKTGSAVASLSPRCRHTRNRDPEILTRQASQA
jgi:hypothetical protein